ncbi:phenylacetate--CoA ligase family protein [Marinitenerispora sediminis]|uniref:CoF synthetase n=1 Tax=Marinitenerispora sediminis TaxID=1931232 RepID=A0A368T765_9ACTN|nr:phenylacetate--CoA ligase family protein [Marinitenerispora sediminis]RCV50906.1 CoF synthetase [Marinitenerispora sediminis]RCV59734.1 CoF synthetase [Marinitenerispora sediminis]RCV59814.1 CoF synthetase [Marinitenerispora sediminis]
MTESSRDIARDVRRAVRQGPAALAQRQRARLAGMVAHARAASPYYRELYRDLPDQVEDPALLPVTDKKHLMDRFDDWVTDRRVTLEQVQAFVADPELVGERFQGRYAVATTSGTSGVRGLFVIDERTVAVHTALGARTGGVGPGAALRLLARAGRTAIVSAPAGHFFTVALPARLRKEHPWMGRFMRAFPIDRPLPELVAELNRYDPAIVSGFLSMLTLLAGEQEAGRLRIRPAVVVAGGETATPEALERLGAAFNAKVRSAYAATECGFLSYGCEHGWYHVNTDWAVFEPVDADHRPVPPGQPSHTVLLSNLANRVQPILRYDLGDSVLLRPDPCPCGDVLPAVRVRGRAADMLTFPTGGGRVSISPMLFGTLLDGLPGVEQFQVVQTAPTTLRVRLRTGDGADAERTWQAVHGEIARLLTEHGAGAVTTERAGEPPQQSPGGKYRRIIPLASG